MFRRKNVSHSEEQNETERTEQKVKELREALGPLMGCHLQYCSDACLRWCDVAMEGETGKLFRANFHDRHGRTVLILRPGMQNTKPMDGQIKHLVYNIENAIFNLPEGQEQMAWLIEML